MKTLNKEYSYFNFEANNVKNLYPYLSINLSNSKSTGSIYFGISDNQTTFYKNVEIKKSGKISKQDTFYLVKRHNIYRYNSVDYVFVTEIEKNEEIYLIIENQKIKFTEFISFGSLCIFHKENKELAIANQKIKIEEREKRDKEIEKSIFIQNEIKNEKPKFDFTFNEILSEFDGMLSDYGNQDLILPEHLKDKFTGDISIFSEKEAEEILLYNDVNICEFINEYMVENI